MFLVVLLLGMVLQDCERMTDFLKEAFDRAQVGSSAIVAFAARQYCKLGNCPCRMAEDENGMWGECIRCGKRVGYIDREILRKFADAEAAREEWAKLIEKR